MPNTKNEAFRNAQIELPYALFDGGELRIKAENNDVLAVVTLEDPAFGSATAGVIEALGLPLPFTGTAEAGAGTNADHADLISDGGTYQITGLSVGLVGANVLINNTNIAEGQGGTVTALAITNTDSVANN